MQGLVQAIAQLAPRTSPPPATSGPEPAAAAPAAAPPSRAPATRPDEYPAPGPRLRLLEGTVIEAVLLNRLDGTFAGPVTCLVTTPVYSHDRQSVLIPAGARALGAASPVQAWGDARLAVSFHRLVMPDGHTYSLDLFKGLDQIGETGLKNEVNRHYWQVFGASLAIGALSGLAQYNTRAFGADRGHSVCRNGAGGHRRIGNDVVRRPATPEHGGGIMRRDPEAASASSGTRPVADGQTFPETEAKGERRSANSKRTSAQTSAHASSWVTPRQAATYIGVGVDTIYEACATGDLKHVKLGYRTIRLRREWIDRWAEDHATPAE